MRRNISKIYRMHNVILGKYDNTNSLGDHKNRDSLDNRRDNLRIASFSVSGFNRNIQSNNTSGTKGVRWHTQNKKWIAQIKVNRRWIYLGSFKSKSLAIEARLKAEDAYNL